MLWETSFTWLTIAGFTLLDVTNPLRLKQIGYFDTHPETNDAAFLGAWGVYPFLPSGTIMLSDIEKGLVILKEQ